MGFFLEITGWTCRAQSVWAISISESKGYSVGCNLQVHHQVPLNPTHWAFKWWRLHCWLKQCSDQFDFKVWDRQTYCDRYFKKNTLSQACFLPYHPSLARLHIRFHHRHKIIYRRGHRFFYVCFHFWNTQITVHVYKMTDPHPLVGRGQHSSAIWCSTFFFLPVFMYFDIFNTIETDSLRRDGLVHGLVYLASVLSWKPFLYTLHLFSRSKQ